jgi:hypothetical protein
MSPHPLRCGENHFSKHTLRGLMAGLMAAATLVSVPPRADKRSLTKFHSLTLVAARATRKNDLSCSAEPATA